MARADQHGKLNYWTGPVFPVARPILVQMIAWLRVITPSAVIPALRQRPQMSRVAQKTLTIVLVHNHFLPLGANRTSSRRLSYKQTEARASVLMIRGARFLTLKLLFHDPLVSIHKISNRQLAVGSVTTSESLMLYVFCLSVCLSRIRMSWCCCMKSDSFCRDPEMVEGHSSW